MKLRTGYLKSAALAAIAACVFAAPSFAEWTPGERIVLRHAASQPIHGIYVVNAGHKAIIEREIPGVSLELTATQGGVENARLLQAGEVESVDFRRELTRFFHRELTRLKVMF